MTAVISVLSVLLDVFSLFSTYFCLILGFCCLINGMDEKNRELRTLGVILLSTAVATVYAWW